ncbi:MAG: hypothetical protein ICV86_18260, partial [Microcoleus sp. T3-bin5]|nr:hypothetical protein [Microcoleus sp. T3-bin5]
MKTLLHQWLGIVRPPHFGVGRFNPESLSGIDGIAVYFLQQIAGGIFVTVAISFLLLLLLTVLRKKWFAIAAMWLIMFLYGINVTCSYQWISWFNLLLPTTFIILAAARFGMLALYAFFLAAGTSNTFPITSDFSSWYAGSTLFVFVVLMTLAIYGFYTSLAGQPLLKGKLPED